MESFTHEQLEILNEQVQTALRARRGLETTELPPAGPETSDEHMESDDNESITESNQISYLEEQDKVAPSTELRDAINRVTSLNPGQIKKLRRVAPHFDIEELNSVDLRVQMVAFARKKEGFNKQLEGFTAALKLMQTTANNVCNLAEHVFGFGPALPVEIREATLATINAAFYAYAQHKQQLLDAIHKAADVPDYMQRRTNPSRPNQTPIIDAATDQEFAALRRETHPNEYRRGQPANYRGRGHNRQNNRSYNNNYRGWGSNQGNWNYRGRGRGRGNWSNNQQQPSNAQNGAQQNSQ